MTRLQLIGTILAFVLLAVMALLVAQMFKPDPADAPLWAGHAVAAVIA